MKESLETRVRLNLTAGVGSVLADRLRARFGSLEEIFDAPEDEIASVRGVGPIISARVRDPSLADRARREIDEARTAGWVLESPGDPGYPVALGEIYDPPLVLYRRGDVPPAGEPGNPGCFAVVGARRSTNFGRRQAEAFGRALAGAGWAVVSGLARGIDTSGHRGALAEGRTIAVLGCGWDSVYPDENALLLREILDAGGAVLTEFPARSAPLPHHFPRRNRIISGISWGVLVLEASRKSGSLITATCALEQGREVFAMPGTVEGGRSTGCHGLIRDGASIVETPEDLLRRLDVRAPPRPTPEASPVGADGAIVEVLRDGEMGIEELTEAVDLRPSEMAVRLLRLEMAGRIQRYPGRRFALAPT